MTTGRVTRIVEPDPFEQAWRVARAINRVSFPVSEEVPIKLALLMHYETYDEIVRKKEAKTAIGFDPHEGGASTLFGVRVVQSDRVLVGLVGLVDESVLVSSLGEAKAPK